MSKATPEMRAEYNFSNAVRGKFYRPKKKQKTLRLDEDIVAWFKKQGEAMGCGYQTLINETLREAMRSGQGVGPSSFLRELVAEEVRRALRQTRRSKAA
jgi:uncharacterized protein (DUF4415 family)